MKKNEMIEAIKANYPKLKNDFYTLLDTIFVAYANGANIEMIYTKPMKEGNTPYEIFTARRGKWIIDVKPYRGQINVSLIANDVKKVIFEVHTSTKNTNVCTRGAYLNKLPREAFELKNKDGVAVDLYDMVKDGVTYHAKWDMRYRLCFFVEILVAIVKNFKSLDFTINNGLIDLYNNPDGNYKLEVSKKEYEDAKPEIIEEEGEGEE